MFLHSFWRALDRFQCFFMIFSRLRCHGYIDTMWSSSDIITAKLVTKHHRWSKAEVHQLRGLLQWEEQTQRLPAPALARKLSWDVMRSFSPRTFKPSWTAWGSKSPSFSDFLVASKNGLPTPTHLVLTFIDGWSAEGLRGGQSAKRKWNRVDLPKGRAWVAGCYSSQPGLSAFKFFFLTVLFHSLGVHGTSPLEVQDDWRSDTQAQLMIGPIHTRTGW